MNDDFEVPNIPRTDEDFAALPAVIMDEFFACLEEQETPDGRVIKPAGGLVSDYYIDRGIKR